MPRFVVRTHTEGVKEYEVDTKDAKTAEEWWYAMKDSAVESLPTREKYDDEYLMSVEPVKE